MKVDKNSRLCSREVQTRLRQVIDIITRDSLLYIIKHNPIESAQIDRALQIMSELITARTNQFKWGG